MPHAVVGAPLGLTRAYRQQWLRAVQRLNLRLLIDAQHQGFVGGMQVQTDDIPHFFNEQRVLGELKRFGAMRLQSKRAPDAIDRALAQPAALGYRAGRPVRGVGRPLLQRQRQHAFHIRVANLARGSGTRFVQQPVQRRATKRPRHLPTAGLLSRISALTCVFVLPAAQARMTRARRARAWADGRRAHRSEGFLFVGTQDQFGNRTSKAHRDLLLVIPMHAQCHLFMFLTIQGTSELWLIAFPN